MVEAEFSRLHKACLQVIEGLMDLDPKEGTPECNLLAGLAAAVDEYERKVYRMPYFKEGDEG